MVSGNFNEMLQIDDLKFSETKADQTGLSIRTHEFSKYAEAVPWKAAKKFWVSHGPRFTETLFHKA